MDDVQELRDLYHEVILEQKKKPKNFQAIEKTNQNTAGYKQQYGDHFTIYVNIKDGTIGDIGFQGSGCAISKASASMMTQMLKGKTEAEAEGIFTKFHDLVTGHAAGDGQGLGKLAVFAGVSEFPLRVKCATL